MKNFNTEDLSFSQDSSELYERKDNRGVSGISNKALTLFALYLSDLIEPFKFFKVKMNVSGFLKFDIIQYSWIWID